MEAFAGSWSKVGHTPTLTEKCEEDFALSTSHHHSASEYQGSEWDGFFNTIEHDHPNARCGFDLSDLPLTSEATCGAAGAAELPLISPYSTTSSSSSTISPPSSATEPVLTWSAPVTSYPQTLLHTGLWSLETNAQPFHSGNFGYEGLGLHLTSPLHQYGGRGDACLSQIYDRPSNDYLVPVKREDDNFPDRVKQHRPYQDDTMENEDDDEAEATDPCYAKLLWTCLKEAPGHTLSLKELYDWVVQNSQKAKDPKTRGWQNSVRHNLSMNAAFERVPPCANQGAKKGSLWRLTDNALREGVISTTRYRKDPKRKPERRGHPAPKRQISGAKGGQATRAATRRQREMQHARSMPYLPLSDHHVRQQHGRHDGVMSPYSPHSTGHSPQLLMTPSSPTSPYHFGIDHEDIMPPLPSYANKPLQVPGFFDDEVKPALSNFEFQHFDLTSGSLFRDRDDIMPDTPSMGTEASFMTDDGLPGLLSRDMSRETTIF